MPPQAINRPIRPSASIQPNRDSTVSDSSTPKSTQRKPSYPQFPQEKVLELDHSIAEAKAPQKRKRTSSGEEPDFHDDENNVALKRARHGSVESCTSAQIPRLVFTPASPTAFDRATHTVPGLPVPRSKRRFSIWGAFCSHPALTLYLATQFMTPDEVMALYSIDKYFHYVINSFLPQVVYGLARRWTTMIPPALIEIYADTTPKQSNVEPDICRIFPWRCYRWLCIADPTRRPMHNVPLPDQQGIRHDIRNSRHVPSFRYLRMLLFRAETVRSILETMVYDHQFLLPPETAETLGKLWFMMDVPTTGIRVALVKNRAYFTNRNLMLAQLFGAKLDMALNGADAPASARLSLGQLLWAQTTLSVMNGILKRHECHDDREILQVYVRWRYVLATPFLGRSVAGIPSDLVGGLQKEGWGDRFRGRPRLNWPSGTVKKGLLPPQRQRLLRPDELVIREFLRRGFRHNRKTYRAMLLGGYHNSKTVEPYPTASVLHAWPGKWWMPQNHDEEDVANLMVQLEEEAAGQADVDEDEDNTYSENDAVDDEAAAEEGIPED